jgi:hypothetical protein
VETTWEDTMTAERTPLFCDTALAERIERMEAQLVTLAARAAHRRNDGRGFVLPLAGGAASFAEPDSPFNKVAGLGFAGIPDAASLDEVELAFAACERVMPPGIEVRRSGDDEFDAWLDLAADVLRYASPGRSPSRTRSAEASTCSSPGLCW